MNRLFYIVGLIFTLNASIWASDIFDFFEAEAEALQIVTASRLSLSIRRAPATVYVITEEDIAATGAQTLWDALRSIPGVDVMATRTFYGEVSIRGLNRALSNRVLVLLDGRTVLNGPFDSVYWEGIPIAMSQIDRIEVVQGPASALYGANAINGVINIITKTPDQLDGGQVRYAAGEFRTHLTDVVYGQREGRTAFSVGGSFRTTNQFENSDLRASEAKGGHGTLKYDLTSQSHLKLSAGIVNHKTQFSSGGGGASFLDGNTGFILGDYQYGKTKVRAFWNYSRSVLSGLSSVATPFVKHGLWEGSLEHAWALNPKWDLVLGGSVRGFQMHSNVYDPMKFGHTMGALFFESAWRASDAWTLVGSGRLDWHDEYGSVLSPRGSLVFSPVPAHVFRFSVGRAFRDPTMTERHLNLTTQYTTPLNISTELTAMGNNLKRERVTVFELGHTGQFGPVKLQGVGFYYRLSDYITNGDLQQVLSALPNLKFELGFVNASETLRAWGGELKGEAELGPHVKLFATYSHQRFEGDAELQSTGPQHKLSGGFRVNWKNLTVDTQVHWVDQTFWSDGNTPTFEVVEIAVPDYALVNTNVSYALGGALKGWRLYVNVYNLMDHRHVQLLSQSAQSQGLNGEEMRRRAIAGFSYRF